MLSASNIRRSTTSPGVNADTPCRSRLRIWCKANSASPSHYHPELSRRARGVELWASMRSLGRAGMAEIVERTCGHALRFAEGLRVAGYEIVNEVVIHQVLVPLGTPEKTLQVVERIQKEGNCWSSSKVWLGRAAMRIGVSSWATIEADMETSLAAMLRAAQRTHGVSTFARSERPWRLTAPLQYTEAPAQAGREAHATPGASHSYVDKSVT